MQVNIAAAAYQRLTLAGCWFFFIAHSYPMLFRWFFKIVYLTTDWTSLACYPQDLTVLNKGIFQTRGDPLPLAPQPTTGSTSDRLCSTPGWTLYHWASSRATGHTNTPASELLAPLELPVPGLLTMLPTSPLAMGLLAAQPVSLLHGFPNPPWVPLAWGSLVQRFREVLWYWK